MIRNLRIVTFLFPVILGGIIYIVFRTERLIMFRWFEYLSISSEITIIQNLREVFSFPGWFIYSLPDGLWVFSYTSISLEIWKNSITKQNSFWIFGVPAVAIASEVLQLFKVIPGTFDLTDIFFYVFGMILSYYISTKLIFNIKNHEKL